jgi:hypothetical protein
VIHGRGVNTAVLLIATALSAWVSAAWTTAAPPPVSPSSTGGASWSCIHVVYLSPN